MQANLRPPMRRGDSNQPPPLRAQLLGETSLAVGDRLLVPAVWPRRAARSLLLLLLATPGHRIGRERAAELLWPEAPAARVRDTRDTWYQALSALRRVLEPDLSSRSPSRYLTADAAYIALRDDASDWIDVDVFEAGLAEAGGLPEERRRRLRSALALYRGDLLAEESEAGWATPRREELGVMWQRGVLTLAELDLDAGEPLATVEALQTVVAADRTAEEVHRALIRAYAVAGEPERAHRQYERCRQALWDDLGIAPSDATRELVEACATGTRRERAPGPVATEVAPSRPPPTPPTPLVGRDREIELVEHLLWRPDVRLVTLTGPGGIGKTRLAIEVARRFDQEGVSVAFVPLAGVRSSDLVMFAVGQALGVRDEGAGSLLSAVLRRVGQHELLLVLDNFEHVADAAGVVAALLAGCPRLMTLTTSRTPLHLGGEHVVTVPPLALPGGRRPSFTALARSDAVTLFIQRARAANVDFALTEQNASTIARICARLDGLPLAIELAAARVRVLSPRAILARLDHQLDLLVGGPRDAPGRLRTMRDAIGWSYDLLADHERTVFRRLSVFAGGATLPAARWVAADGHDGPATNADMALSGTTDHPLDVPEELVALVDHSLLRQEDQADGEPRFSMLETVRAYAMERLHASGEAGAVQRRQAAWLIAFAEAVAPRLAVAAEAADLDQLAIELDNVRTALAWSLEHGEAALALRLASATFHLWFVRAMPSEGLQWLEKALAVAHDAPGVSRTDALLCAASLASLQGDIDRHLALVEAGLAVARAHEDQLGAAVALFHLGVAAEWRRHLDRAALRYEESLALMRQLNEPYWVALLLSNLGDVNLWQGRISEAAVLANEGLIRWREIGNDWGIAQSLGTVAAVASEQGDQARAADLYRETLVHSVTLGDRRGIAGTLAGVAGVAGKAGAPRQAARLLGAARAVGDVAGVRHLAHHLQFERVVSATHAQLDDRTFTDEWASGQALSIEQAIAEARSVAGLVATADSAPWENSESTEGGDDAIAAARTNVTPLRPRSRPPRRA